jgi:general secretion pathway protein K
LVLTLWVLAAIAIAAAYFGERVQASLRLATSRQDQAEALIALSDGRAELLWRLGVTPLSAYGLGDPPHVLKLDGRTYSDAGTEVQLQESAGLVNLNRFDPAFLGRLLRTLGVPDDHQANLRDSLLDYTDADDLRRLNGAEAINYREAGRPDLPRNSPLIVPGELRDVRGWAAETDLWRANRVLDFVTTSGGSRLNPNTAPWQVLTALPGVTPDLARLIIARRELEPISTGWLDRTLGTSFDTFPSPLVAFPQGAVRVTQRVPGLAWGLRYNVELTPIGASAPWKISAYQRLELLPPESALGEPPATSPASSPSSKANAPDLPRFPPRPVESASAPFLLAP